MPLNDAFFATWTPRARALLRIVTAYLFLTHGTSKLLSIPHVAAFDNLQLFSLIGVAGILELVGGVLLLLGLFTRPVAFVLCGEMARVEGVLSVHDLHVWTLSGSRTALSAHVVVRSLGQWDRTLVDLQRRLHERFGIDHVTLQPETATRPLVRH